MDVTPDAAARGPFRPGGPTGPVEPPPTAAMEDLAAWLRLHGLDPDEVPTDGVYLDDDDHEVVIVERYLRRDGARYIDATTGVPAREVAARVRIDRPAPHLPVASAPSRRLAELEQVVRAHADRVRDLEACCYWLGAAGVGDTRNALTEGLREANAALHAAVDGTAEVGKAPRYHAISDDGAGEVVDRYHPAGTNPVIAYTDSVEAAELVAAALNATASQETS